MEDRGSTQGLPVISPKNMLPVRVIRRIDAARDAVTLSIVLPGTTQAPAPYLPGQFVTLALPTMRDALYRSYSLCGDGDPEKPWEITVKRQHMGAVSTYFYQSVEEGTLLYSSLPRGTFTLPPTFAPDDRFIFVAVGSGITPIFGMLRYLARLAPEDRPLVQLHYASRALEDIIYRAELEEMDPYEQWLQQFHYLSSEGDRLTVEAVLVRAGRAVPFAQYYYCGPDALKHELLANLAEEAIPQSQIHAEVFATQQAAIGRPAYRLAGQPNVSDGGVVYIAQTGATLHVDPQETLLTALERHGYHPDFSCRAGACGACKLKVLAGTVDPVGESLTPADRHEGYVLSCIAHPLGEVTLAYGGRPPVGVKILDPAFAQGSGRSLRSVALIRVGALAALSLVMGGAWTMTDHRPFSWNQADAASGTTTGPSGGGSTTGTSVPSPSGPVPTQPVAAPTPRPTATNAPVPTPRPGVTVTPKPIVPTPTSPPAPTATPRPAPTPTATAKPSK